MKTIRKARIQWERVNLVSDETSPYGTAVASSCDVVKIAHSLIADEVTEVFIVLALDNKGKVAGYSECARGGSTNIAMTPLDVFRFAVLSSATRIVVAHNHPSGDPTPSAEDVAFTKRLAESAEVLGIRLDDHVIIGDGSTFSFCDRGMMNFVDE